MPVIADTSNNIIIMEIWHNLMFGIIEMMEFGILFVCIFLFAVIFQSFRLNSHSKLPGPWNLPIIGSLYHIGFNTHKGIKYLTRKCGNIFHIVIGSQKIVVLSGLDTIQEGLITNYKTFSGRPELFTFQYLSEGKSLSFNPYNREFNHHKGIAEKAINIILGNVNTIVTKESKILIENLNLTPNKPVDPLEPILWSVGHVMYDLCFGNSRNEPEDFKLLITETIRLIDLHNDGNSGNILNFFPWTRRVIKWKVNNIEVLCKRICSMVIKKEKEHVQSYTPGKIRNVLDALICSYEKSSKKVDFNRILHSSQDFIGAGFDILYITLTWCVLYLAEYPEIQNKIRKEILSTIGRESPIYADAIRMPYTMAFIHEVLRHASVVPYALPHCTLKESKLKGYDIPKDTLIMINLNSVLRDPNIWDNPEEFNPERFIREGKLEVDTSRFIPFGLGKRKCLGQNLTKNIIYIYTAVLVQSFEITKPDHVKSYDLTPKSGLILKPKPFQVIFKEIN